MTNDQKSKKNDKWTKLMFATLIFFGVTTLFLGILRLNNTITNGILPADLVKTNQNQNNANSEPTIEELMVTDTDGDGLSDYQEMYVYGTSIYLADTDSDGYLDKEEIDGGYDPNCPKGMDCRETTDITQTTNDNLNNNIDLNNTDVTTGDGISQLSAEQKAQLQNLSASELRQLLIASGEVTEEELNQIDDATLMQSFSEVMNQ